MTTEPTIDDGADATADLPRIRASEQDGSYPRPQLLRERWADLSGAWGFDFDDEDRGRDENWQRNPQLSRSIRVPFPPESTDSGINDTQPHRVVWYQRDIGAVILGPYDGIEEGQQVRRTGEILSVPVGDGFLGRVIDPLGAPIDEREVQPVTHAEPIEGRLSHRERSIAVCVGMEVEDSAALCMGEGAHPALGRQPGKIGRRRAAPAEDHERDSLGNRHEHTCAFAVG